jgi:hypothetical protein
LLTKYYLYVQKVHAEVANSWTLMRMQASPPDHATLGFCAALAFLSLGLRLLLG